MRKMIILGRRAPGRSRNAVHAHMRNVHSALVLLPPEDAGSMPIDYTQNHVFDGVYPAAGAHAIERDMATEIWPDPRAAGQAKTPYYYQQLQPDEENFVDNSSVVKLLTDAQAPTAGADGHFKVFLALTGGDPAAAVGAIPEALSSAINRVLPIPAGVPLFVDCVVEFWFSERAAAAAVLERWPLLLAATGANPAASLAVCAEQFDSARLRAMLAERATPTEQRLFAAN